MNTTSHSRFIVIATLTALITLTGCSIFSQTEVDGQRLPIQSTAVVIPGTGSISGTTQSQPTIPTPLVVSPTPKITQAPVATETPQESKAVVAADNLNLRIGPGINYAVVRLLQQGLSVIPAGRSIDGLWIEIHTSDGSAGWVFGSYLQTSIDLAVLPVTEAHGGPDNPAPTLNSSYSILVLIEDNVATVTIARFPPNRKITATLGPTGKAPGLVVAEGKTDASGRTTLSFEMPANWEDGNRVTENDLFLAVSTNDSSFSRQVSVVYIH
jgi:uncharacterized protein YgiM (DUF1202 family)